MSLNHTLETYAYRNGLNYVEAWKKIILTISALLITVSSSSTLKPVLIIIILAFLTVGVAKIPWRLYVKIHLTAFGFIAPAVVVMLYTQAGYVLLTVSKALSGASSLLFLALTTPSTELFTGLRRLRTPAIFTELVMLTYRYIFLLMDEGERMTQAQTLRLGYSGYHKGIISLGILSASLFARAVKKAERIQQALEARGG